MVSTLLVVMLNTMKQTKNKIKISELHSFEFYGQQFLYVVYQSEI